MTCDPAGRMTSLTDASGNTTSWTFGATGQVIEETITVDSAPLSRSFSYDAAGNLVEKTDRNGRVTKYTYDNLLRQTTEAWYDDTSDTTANLTYSTTYDAASRVASVSDGSTTLSYEYSIFGNLTSQTQSLNGLADDVTFSYRYDAAGRKTLVASKIGTTENYINEYDYDSLGRIVKLTQSGASIAEKRVDIAYADDGFSSTLTRYADLEGLEMVARTKQSYDALGRVQNITHADADTVFANYDYTWDAASRITEIDMDFSAGNGDEYDDTASYDYDATNQLTAATYDDETQSNEDYDYDEIGNRTLVDNTDIYTTGDANRLLTDGTFYFTYDEVGNMTGKYSDAARTVPVEKYYWDHRNRLTKVELYDAQASLETTVYYAYDHNNRLYERTVDGDTDSRQIFVRDDDHIVMELADDNTGDVTSSDVSRRVLWLPGSVDHCLAEEIDGGATYWTLLDHLNTVRDVVSYSLATHLTSLAQHNTFSSFGEFLSTPTIETIALWTGRLQDYLTKKQTNRERWYDALLARWMSEDPISFQAGDVNLYRYVGNFSIVFTDPHGYWKSTTGPSPYGSYFIAEKGDDLDGLVEIANHVRGFWTAFGYYGGSSGYRQLTNKNTICIRPVVDGLSLNVRLGMMKEWGSGRAYECGVYDIGNLIDSYPDGGPLLLHSESEYEHTERAHDELIYPLPDAMMSFFGIPAETRRKSGSEVAHLIEWFSDEGKRPIGSLLLLGHGGRGDFRAYHLGTNRQPSFTDAVDGKLPSLCWFRTDAVLRFVGCESKGFASTMSEHLRGNAVSYGTTKLLAWDDERSQMMSGRLLGPLGFLADEWYKNAGDLFERGPWEHYDAKY